MCRLYGFLASEPTKVECTLVHAQNALIAQSESDQSGTSHAHGWGVAMYRNGKPHIEKRAWAAYHGEHFERVAAKTYAELVIAHVRKATVGVPKIENSHPFSERNWVFAHNGTVPDFENLRALLIEKMTDVQRGAIRGDTDSEHVFRYFLSMIDKDTYGQSDDIVVQIGKLASDIAEFSNYTASSDQLGFNTILCDGERLAGTRINRGLFYVDRRGVYDCEICGFPHIHHDESCDYRAIVIASEPLTQEHWIEIPNNSVWEANFRDGVTIRPWRYAEAEAARA